MQTNNFFSNRLKNERIRLNMSQEELGEACGVKKLAQFNYEKGSRQPKSEYLEKAAQLGVDVGYLFTGVRTPEIELIVSKKLASAIQQAIDDGNPEGAKNLQDANKEMQDARIRRGENALKREDELRQITYSLLELDDDTFERMADTIKDAYLVNKVRQAQEPEPKNDISNNIDVKANDITGSVIGNANKITGSFNTEGGFTEAPFIFACALCGGIAWLLAAVAISEVIPNVQTNLNIGWISIGLWLITMLFALFGYDVGKRQYKKSNA